MHSNYFAIFTAAGKVASLGETKKLCTVRQREIILDCAHPDDSFSRSIALTLYGPQCDIPLAEGDHISVAGTLDGRPTKVTNNKMRFYHTLDVEKLTHKGKEYNYDYLAD